MITVMWNLVVMCRHGAIICHQSVLSTNIYRLSSRNDVYMDFQREIHDVDLYLEPFGVLCGIFNKSKIVAKT